MGRSVWTNGLVHGLIPRSRGGGPLGGGPRLGTADIGGASTAARVGARRLPRGRTLLLGPASNITHASRSPTSSTWRGTPDLAADGRAYIREVQKQGGPPDVKALCAQQRVRRTATRVDIGSRRPARSTRFITCPHSAGRRSKARMEASWDVNLYRLRATAAITTRSCSNRNSKRMGVRRRAVVSGLGGTPRPTRAFTGGLGHELRHMGPTALPKVPNGLRRITSGHAYRDAHTRWRLHRARARRPRCDACCASYPPRAIEYRQALRRDVQRGADPQPHAASRRGHRTAAQRARHAARYSSRRGIRIAGHRRECPSRL